MKILCYFALLVAFLMFYQKNPLYALMVVVVGIGLFLIVKLRKKGRGASNGSFLSGRSRRQEENNLNNLIAIILTKELLKGNKESSLDSKSEEYLSRDKEIDKIKEKVLELLEED